MLALSHHEKKRMFIIQQLFLRLTQCHELCMGLEKTTYTIWHSTSNQLKDLAFPLITK
jgi:hypothetical protein